MASRLNLNGISIKLTANAIALLIALQAGASMAQDQSNFTQFFINPYVLNSSYAGLDGQPSASVIYRKQWMTIDGAPTITNLSLHAPLKGRMSAGVNLTNDSKGFFSNTTLLVSVAYHVPIQDQTFVRFGLSAGGSWNTVDMNKLEDFISDPALGDALDKNAALAGNAGLSFHHRTFNAGISLPSIFSPAYVSDESFNVKEVKPFQALVVHATNRFYFNSDKNIFEPYLLYHANMDLPSQFEFAGIVHLNHLVWTGASYKQYFGVSALGGIKMKNYLAIGASYSIQQSGIDQLNSPSFEVSLNYLFGKRRRDAPLYSFVNANESGGAGKMGAAQRASSWRQKQVEAQQQRREEAAKLRLLQEEQRRQAEGNRQPAKQQPANQQPAGKETKGAQLAAVEPVQGNNDPVKGVSQNVPDQQSAREQERPVGERIEEDVAISEEGINEVKIEPQQIAGQTEVSTATDAKPVADPVVAESIIAEQPPKVIQPGGQQPSSAPGNIPEERPQSEQLRPTEQVAVEPAALAVETPAPSVRHEIYQRGDHAQELEASEYVVAGVFKSIGNARHFSEGLRSLGFNAQFGYLTPKDLWYVYVLKSNDIQKARDEQQRVSKLFLLRDAWLLTVEP